MAHDLDELTTDVTASVKWYNLNKGFGFVQPDNGGGDAFLHASVMTQAGQQDLSEGDVLRCDIAAGPRGPQVVAIHSVERSSQPRRDWRHFDDDTPAEVIDGVVKFFDATKGFGFIAPDAGGKDIFISARTLNRSGLGGIEPGQRVKVTRRMGQKGPMADDVTLI